MGGTAGATYQRRRHIVQAALFAMIFFAASLTPAGRLVAQTGSDAASSNGDAGDTHEDPKFEEAKERFLQGLTLARAGDCRAALAEFDASYALVPRPSTLYNIAQCQEQLFRYDLAVAYYERYLSEAESDAPDRPAVEQAMRTLSNLLGTISVASNVEAEVWLGDRIVGQAPGDVLVPPGTHQLELRADGYLPSRKEVQIAGRQRVEVRFEMEQAEQQINQTVEQNIQQHYAVTRVEERGLSPMIFWGGVAGTVVAAGVGGIFGLQAMQARDDADNMDPRLPKDDKISEIEDNALLADIFFGTAGVLAVASTVAFLLTDWDGPESTPPVRVDAQAGRHGGTLTVRGSF